MGSVSLLQNVTVSSQPISSMDWSPDKVQKHTYIHTEYGTTLLSTPPPPPPSLLSCSLHLYLSSLFPSPLLSISLIFPSPSLSLLLPFSFPHSLHPSLYPYSPSLHCSGGYFEGIVTSCAGTAHTVNMDTQR